MKPDRTPDLRIEPEIHHDKENSTRAKEKPILE
jgi:hypothetical protein